VGHTRLFEAFAMLLVGAAGWGFGGHIFITIGWERVTTIRVSLRPRYSGFWVSVGMAGCCVAYPMCILSFAVLLRLRSGKMYRVQTLDESIQERSSVLPYLCFLF